MSCVIDVCVFPIVFGKPKDDLPHLSRIAELLYSRRELKIVVGGTKFQKEIRKVPMYLSLLSQWKIARKVAFINDAYVDRVENELVEQLNQCNDLHIIALLSVSGCRLVVTSDKPFVAHIKKCNVFIDGKRRSAILEKRVIKRKALDVLIGRSESVRLCNLINCNQ